MATEDQKYDRYIKIVIDSDKYRQRREGVLKEKAQINNNPIEGT